MTQNNNIKTSPCFTVEELLQMVDLNFKNKQVIKMREHIKQCKSCKRLYEDILCLDVAIKTKDFYIIPKYKEKCPDEQHIAAYVDNLLAEKEKHRIERHLRNCDNCLHQIVLLFNTLNGLKRSELETIPESVLLQMKQMFPEKITGINRWKNLMSEYFDWANEFFNQKRSLRWIGYSIGALFFIFIMYFQLNEIFVDSSVSKNEMTRVEKEIFQSEIKLVVPKHGTIIHNTSITFIWQKQAKVQEYHFTLANNVGDLIWETRVKKNMVKLPQGVKLGDNINYFWKVEAHMRDGFVISSPVSFFLLKKK